MIRRTAGCLGIDPAEPKLGQIEFVGKDVDHPNGIVLADPVFQASGKQRVLPAIRALNEALHPIPPQIAQESYRENHIKQGVFTQPGSRAAIEAASSAAICSRGQTRSAQCVDISLPIPRLLVAWNSDTSCAKSSVAGFAACEESIALRQFCS